MTLNSRNQLVLEHAKSFGCIYWCSFDYSKEVKNWLSHSENFSEAWIEKGNLINLTPLYSIFSQEEPLNFYIGFKSIETYTKFLQECSAFILLQEKF